MIYYADNKFNDFIYNPFNDFKTYDDSWILLKLIDKAEFTSYTGNNGDEIFRLILTKQNSEWRYCLMDFLEYETSYNKNIIVAVDKKDLLTAQEVYEGHCYTDNFLRPYEHPVLVHTTTPYAYENILKSGALMSWNKLHSKNINFDSSPIGALLKDPGDYSDFIMFNNGGYFSEIVVSSKEKGYIEMDPNALYDAGARFYFDAKKIAEDGLLVRDGAHLKVKDYLEIDKYLLWIATPEKLNLPQKTTPYEFGTKSDEMFKQMFNI